MVSKTLAWVLGIIGLIFLCGFISAAVFGGYAWLRPERTVEVEVVRTVEVPFQGTPMGSTPEANSNPAPADDGQCRAVHIDAGKPFSFVIEAGKLYHVNYVSGTGATGEANVVFRANSAQEITVPEGSGWEYPPTCSFEELVVQTTRDSLDDDWPVSLPNWLSEADVILITVR